jgi:hypothetical protein
MHNASLGSGRIDQDQVAAFCQLQPNLGPLSRDMRAMQFHANYVSTSVGDHYAATAADCTPARFNCNFCPDLKVT